MAATKRARLERAMVTAMRVVGNKEGKGDDEKDGGGDKAGVRRRGQWQQLSDDVEGDKQAMATRAIVTAVAMAKATTWVMVMVTRLAGDEEGKGKGGKGDGDDDEGGARATERAREARQWQRRQGWRASGRQRRQRGQWLQ